MIGSDASGFRIVDDCDIKTSISNLGYKG
jgi:hypothetical protein